MLTSTAEALAVRRVPVLQPNGRKTYSVVGSDGLPIPDVESYLGYLRATGHSANTVRAYAGHLAFLFRWTAMRGIAWELLDFDAFVAFIDDMADGTVPALTRAGQARPRERRGRATLEATLAAVCAFLDYWRLEGHGPGDLKLYREARVSAPRAPLTCLSGSSPSTARALSGNNWLWASTATTCSSPWSRDSRAAR